MWFQDRLFCTLLHFFGDPKCITVTLWPRRLYLTPHLPFISTAEALQREQQREKEKLEKEKGNQLLSFAHFLYTRLYVRRGASLSDVSKLQSAYSKEKALIFFYVSVALVRRNLHMCLFCD